MRRFVKGWKTGGHEPRLGARIVNYADDFVICCRGTAAEAMTVMRSMMSRLKLTVNETKTRKCRVPEETFDFLGHTFGRNYSPRTGGAYLGAKPSGKKIQRLCRAISEMTGRGRTLIPVEQQVVQLNQKLRGWNNYFRVGTVSRAYNVVNQHVTYRLRQWLCAKHKVRGPGYSRFPDRYLYQSLGLYKLQRKARAVSVRVNRLVREPGAGNPPARFDERGVETGHGRDNVTPADERAGQQGKQTST